jgi:hypothetical protein
MEYTVIISVLRQSQQEKPTRDFIPLSALFIRGKKERQVGGWVGGQRSNRRKETKTKKVEHNKQKQNKKLLFLIHKYIRERTKNKNENNKNHITHFPTILSLHRPG